MTIEARRIESRLKRRIDVPIEWDAMEALETPANLAVYFALTRLALAENNSAPGVEAIARTAKMGRSTLMRCLNELERKGIVVRTRTKLENGMKGRTIFSIMGTDAFEPEDVVPNRDDVVPASVVPNRDVDRGTGSSQIGTTQNAGVSQSGPGSGRQHAVAAVLPPQQHGVGEPNVGALVDALVAVGMDQYGAKLLASAKPEECRRQLEALPKRPPARNPAGMLRRAIEEGWSLPEEGRALSMLPVVEERRPPCWKCDGAGMVEEGGDWINCPACNAVPLPV